MIQSTAVQELKFLRKLVESIRHLFENNPQCQSEMLSVAQGERCEYISSLAKQHLFHLDIEGKSLELLGQQNKHKN